MIFFCLFDFDLLQSVCFLREVATKYKKSSYSIIGPFEIHKYNHKINIFQYKYLTL